MVEGERTGGLANFPSLSMFGNKPGNNITGKSVSVLTAGTASQIPNCRQRPICPKCGEKKVWRDSHRTNLFGPTIQRWLCSSCFFRFSDPVDLADSKKAQKEAEKMESMGLKSAEPIQFNCQICVQETKNLTSDSKTVDPKFVDFTIGTKLQKPADINAVDIKTLRGAVVNFLFYLQQQERAASTREQYGWNLDFLVTHGANLFDPLSVKDVLVNKLKDEVTQKDKTNVRKYTLLKAYRAFATAYEIDITPAKIPKYKPNRKIPYLPPEPHMDQLIAACSYEMAAFLQTLKETAARPVEAMRILWKEIDFIQAHIPINHPAKGCNARVLRMSEKLINMLKNLPHITEKVFIYKNERAAGKAFRVMRQHAIIKTGIKELRKISFYTFRYWRATVEFQETQKEVPTMILLGHKSTHYLWLYVQLSHIYFSGTPKYSSIWVTDREQETKLNDEGYTFIRTDPIDGASLYRKTLHCGAQLIGHD